MNKIIANENSYIEIDETNKEILGDLVNIGYQLKNELGLKAVPIQVAAVNKIYIGNIVGNVALNSTNLIINPKYVDSDITTEESLLLSKRLIERSIKCATDNIDSTIYFYKNNMIDEQNEFFDSLAKYYLDKTIQALRKSKICLYEDRTEKVRTIKGRILVQRQLSAPMTDEKTWCRYKRLTDNNIYNQLLYWGCKYLIGLASNIDLKQKLLTLSREFPQTTQLLNKHDVSTLKAPRQFSEYEESLNMAKRLYLDSLNKKERLGADNRVCGYAINMELSFENIVEYYSRIAANRIGFIHKAQATKQLAVCQTETGYDFDVRPDDLISKGHAHLVMDAKYKTLSINEKGKRKPLREDFYQMISSCVAYRCHEAVLVYPESSGFKRMKWCTNNMINDYKCMVHSGAIDLYDMDENVIAQMTSIIKDTLFFEEVSGE